MGEPTNEQLARFVHVFCFGSGVLPGNIVEATAVLDRSPDLRQVLLERHRDFKDALARPQVPHPGAER